jgi:REP element-mobilizing transposase RayT
LLCEIAPIWETDGIRLLESTWAADKLQVVFSTKPNVSPLLLSQRAKGRLTHALRSGGYDNQLSRKVCVRTLGDNIASEVERYIEQQVKRANFIDPRFEEGLAKLTVCDCRVDLSQPSESNRVRYWYNVHLVLVVAERFSIGDTALLRTLRDACLKVAAKKQYVISRLAIMPDHLHVAMRGNSNESPEEIAFAFQNNLAFAAGQTRIWQDTYYVGTFGEYNMNAVRGRIAETKGSRKVE